MAKGIEKEGFVPGIWFAPLQCNIFTKYGRHKQNLFIKSPSSSPVMFNEGTLFDFTLPDVQNILFDWFSLARKSGFKLFKIDYIYRNFLEKMSLYYGKEHGRIGVVREGLKAIREAVGDDAHIINCGAPVESMMGFAESSRMTMDVHTFWGHIKHNSTQMAVKLWQNGKLWTIDPDFAVVRSNETTDDVFPNYIYKKRPLKKGGSHWMAGSEASLSELKTLLVLTRITGGNVFLSDSICRLNKKGIDALAGLFPPLERGSKALDLFCSGKTAPSFWLNKSGKKTYMAVFNWEDEAMDISVPKGISVPSKGRDVFSGKNILISSKTLMPPRSAYLLEV